MWRLKPMKGVLGIVDFFLPVDEPQAPPDRRYFCPSYNPSKAASFIGCTWAIS